MKSKSIFTLTVMAAALAGCGGGPDQIACGQNGNQIVCRTDGQPITPAATGQNAAGSPSRPASTSPGTATQTVNTATVTQTGSPTQPVAPSIPAPSTQTPTQPETPPVTQSGGSTTPPPQASSNVVTVGSVSAVWPANPFSVDQVIAPPDKAVLHGVQFLSVVGHGLINVELLPPTGYEPKYATCAAAKDFDFTLAAECKWDTSKLENGWYTVRISAFNVPSGESGDEIVAMTRTYFLANGICTQPGATLSPGQAAFCAGQIGPDGQPVKR